MNEWGGKRLGAGRPKGSVRKPPTVVKRIPVDRLGEVEKLLAVKTSDAASQELATPMPARIAPTLLKRPLFSSHVSAGFPSPADDYVEGQLDLNDFLIRRPAATFYVRVTGESMSGAGIFPGDLLIVDRAEEAEHKKIVIAVVDDDLTVKWLYKKGRVVELRPDNPDYEVIRCTDHRELTIWGVVTGVVRKL